MGIITGWLARSQNAARRSPGYKWWVLNSTSLAGFLSAFDVALAIIVLPALATAFDATAAQVIWVGVGTFLVIVSITMPIGALGDLVGRRRLYRWGFPVHVVALLGVIAAPDLISLIAARLAVGVGIALYSAPRNAIAAEAFPENQRGTAMGVIIGAVAIGLALGPFLGGWLTDLFGWRAVFVAELPFALLGAVITLPVLRPEGPSERQRGSLDWGGSVAVVLGLVGLVLASNRLPELGLTHPLVLAAGAVGLTGTVVFFLIETRVVNPILDLALLRSRALLSATGALGLQNTGYAVAILVLPFYLIGGLGLSTTATGVVSALVPGAMAVSSFLGGYLGDRWGNRTIAVGSLLVNLVGAAGLVTLTAESPLWQVAVPLVLFGLGTGSVQAVCSSAMLGAVPVSRLGMGSALFMAAIFLTLTAGGNISGILLTARQGAYEATLGAGAQAVASAYREIAAVGAVIIFLATLSAVFQTNSKPRMLIKS